MGYFITVEKLDRVLKALSESYEIYGPKLFVRGGRFTDTDMIRYDKVASWEEMEWSKRSDYSFKEVLLPLRQTLFYFTEDRVKEADPERTKGALIFLRSCDLHAVKRLDAMYLRNGEADYYYSRLRKKVRFVLVGCQSAGESCFCVDMKTNVSDEYDIGLNIREGKLEVDCKWEEASALFDQNCSSKTEVAVDHVTETRTRVKIPENLSSAIAKASMWEEYSRRCIGCGRCNFVCPTCTCFTMQDMYFDENGKTGQRRRVAASCMVDGYTDVAGGGAYRRKKGERMRFKVMHKVYDFKQREGFHMCVGCGRCDDICPEYISFSHVINRLEEGMKEVCGDE